MTAWYDDPIFQGNAYATTYKGPGTDTPHYAYDVQTPFHTPLTAPTSGTVIKADYQAWGGEIFVQPDNSTLPEWYMYHPDELEVSVGQHVNAGQEIALSGGENPGYAGAEHPASTTYSSGPHTHIGWFTKWITPPETGSTIPYGPDPANLMQMAKGGGSNGGFNVPSSIYTAIEPIAHADNVPDPIWETIAQVESNFNSKAVGDNGTSYGIFQLHQGGQLGNLTQTQAFDPATNARAAMPSIQNAWNTLGSSFDPNSSSWWAQFAAQSGHPAENGNVNDPAVIAEAQKLKDTYNQGNGGAASTPTTSSDPISQLTSLLTTGAKPFAMRVGVGLVGVILIFLGASEIGKALGVQGDIANVAKAAVL